MTLSLNGCIPVQDFGEYWDRATIDKQIAGSWKRIAAAPDQDAKHGYPIGDVMTFVEKGAAYESSDFDAFGKLREKPVYPIKTLEIGKYQFLAFGPTKGIIVRYVITGSNLALCMQFGPAMKEFLTTHYPRAVNVKINDAEGEYIQIGLFDDEVIRILSSIPDLDITTPSATEGYWVCDVKYERLR
jgi:hypothetical protein